jgi:TolB protein
LAFLPGIGQAQAPGGAVKRFVDTESPATARGLRVEGRVANQLKVAVADLELPKGPDNELQVQYAKTMEYDLDFADYFKPLPSNPGMVAQHRKDQQVRAIDYGAWQKLGCELLVKGELEDLGNKGNIRLYAYDVNEQSSIVALEYTVQYDSSEKKIREVRRAVHNFVDSLVQKYDPDGLNGCAHSYIAFENATWRTDTGGAKKKIREIFIMDYDGRNIRQITQDRDLCLSPAWSPDARKLVYTSFRQSNPDLYIYNLDTGKIRVLAAFPGMNGAAAWSPDGNRLAVTLSRDGNPEIYTISADGTDPRRLTKSRNVETSPVWSKDGSSIFFISDRSGAPQIWRMSSSGGSPTVIARGGQNDDPSVSPRGDLLAYTSSQGGGGFNIWVCDVNGGGARNLTGDLSGGCEQPSWASDGRHIVFNHKGQLVIMDADGSDKRFITSEARIHGENAAPAWGP